MRKLIYVSLAFIGLTACGQQKNVPQNIISTFNQKFPAAKEIKWAKEDATTWEAEFEFTDKDMSANFDLKGNWLETETELAFKDLPEAVKATISASYKGYKVKEVGFTETPQLKAFEVEVEKGNKLIEVVMDGFGKVISAKSIGEEKDND